MIDDHVHCENCGAVILRKIKLAGGKTKDAEIRTVIDQKVMITPDGRVAAAQVEVPICVDCHEKVEEARIEMEKQIAEQRRSSLVVAGARAALVGADGRPL